MIKFLFQPVKPFSINQRFGENNACVSDDGANTVITCDGAHPPAGYSSLYGPEGHTGLDLRAYHGQEVYCAFDGIVDFIDTHPRTGLDVRVVSEMAGKRYRHIYEHLLGYQGRVGDALKTGQLVGWTDNTGYSSNDHLHFELQEWRDGKWVPIDPLPFMFPAFARDELRAQSVYAWASETLARIADNLADRLRQASKVTK